MNNVNAFEARRQQLEASRDRELVHRVARQHGLSDTTEQLLATYLLDHKRPGAAQTTFQRPPATSAVPELSESSREFVSELVASKRESNVLFRDLGLSDRTISGLLRTNPEDRLQRQQNAVLRDDLTQLAAQFGLSGGHVDQLFLLTRSR